MANEINLTETQTEALIEWLEMAKVIRVRTHSPDFLDESLRKLPAAAEVLKDSWDGDTCLVRIISDAEFIKYSIDKQGFGEIVPIEER